MSRVVVIGTGMRAAEWATRLAAAAHDVSVDDQATAAFMQSFYTALFTRQRTPAEALADARQSLRKQPRYAHPWYWAAFTLHGQWQ